METASKRLGGWGEELASRFLSRKGYKILLKNFISPLGEIDLIARHKDVLVFVEVKARSSIDKGLPVEAVTFHKRAQLVKVAQYYMKRYSIQNIPCRFDVVSILFLSGKEAQIELVQNAFYEGE